MLIGMNLNWILFSFLLVIVILLVIENEIFVGTLEENLCHRHLSCLLWAVIFSIHLVVL